MTYSFKKTPTQSRVRTILIDLADIIEEESFDVYRPLADAAVILLRESANAITNPIDSVQMNKDLIIAAMDFNQRYETWLANIRNNELGHYSERTFHEMLLRFSKGSVKAWRCWRIDKLK